MKSTYNMNNARHRQKGFPESVADAETLLSVQSIIDTHQQPFLLINRAYQILAANTSFRNSIPLGGREVVGQDSRIILFGPGDATSEDKVLETMLTEVFDSLEPIEQILSLDLFGDTRLTCRVKGFPVEAHDHLFYLGLMITPMGKAMDESSIGSKMVGQSAVFTDTLEKLILASNSDSSVLLTGESGTGKELAAQFIHEHSVRKTAPFITVDCTVLGEHLFESQLFGHEKGSFTGSTGLKKGLFELADGGTLFLDEIGEIPLEMQPKLLRALETNSFRRVGGTKTLTSDIRVVCATNRDLQHEVNNGRFRQDLYYRFAVFPIEIPTLKQRIQDLPLIVEYFLDQIRVSTGRMYQLSFEALEKLTAYDFPGNIRELRNLVQLAAALTQNGVIRPEHLHFGNGRSTIVSAPADDSMLMSETELADGLSDMERFEANQISELLSRHGGSRRKAAVAMGISERTLYRKLKKYNLK
ncbi:MAG: sigma-54 dependent transcriptional regulator [Sedimenticola sp.]